MNNNTIQNTLIARTPWSLAGILVDEVDDDNDIERPTVQLTMKEFQRLSSVLVMTANRKTAQRIEDMLACLDSSVNGVTLSAIITTTSPSIQHINIHFDTDADAIAFKLRHQDRWTQ